MTDKQLVRFCERFRRGILGGRSSAGMCDAICWPLVSLLKMNGIPVELVCGSVGICEHYWMVLPDGRIIDPTADQFDDSMPAVYLGARPKNYLTEVPASP